MSQHEDREKVLSAFGGKKGLIDSGIPAVIFLIVFNVTDELRDALFASIAVSAILTITRLAMRDTVQHAVSGFIGVLICAWFANRTGNASDLYIPKLLTNLGYGTVYLIANLAGWPILGLLLGPILGAMATEAWNWRAAFFMIVPPGIATLVCIWFALAGKNERKPASFDWTGFLTLSIAIICIQLILDRGQRLDWFEAPEMIACAVIGAISFYIFVAHCLTSSAPFLNPRLFLDRNFSIGTAIAFVMGMLAFTSLTLFPTMLHDLRGYPDDAVSILIAARGMGNWVAFLVVVQLTRWAPRFTIGLGLFFQAASGFWMAQFDINVTEAQIFWSHLLQGFGQSIAFTPMTVMAFSTLPAHQVTEGSAIFTLMRNFGSSLFISIAVMMLIRSSSANYARLGEFVTPYNKLLFLPSFPASWDLESTSGLLRLAGEIQRQAAMIGYVNAFHLMAATAALSVPLAFFMRRANRAG